MDNNWYWDVSKIYGK